MAGSRERRDRYLKLVDASLGFLFRCQEMEDQSRSGEMETSRATAQLAFTAAWAYRNPKSAFHRSAEAMDRAARALDWLARMQEAWKSDLFAMPPMGAAILAIDAGSEQKAKWRNAFVKSMEFQRREAHFFGEYTNMDIYFCAALAMCARLTGDSQWQKLAGLHLRKIRPNVISLRDGFHYASSSHGACGPSPNYQGVATSILAWYYALSGDEIAAEMLHAAQEYFIYNIRPSGVVDFNDSMWPKRSTEVKVDSFGFAVAGIEMTASLTRDGRLVTAAEKFTDHLEALLAPGGRIWTKPWPDSDVSWVNPYKPASEKVAQAYREAGKRLYSADLQALATGFLAHAYDWCPALTPKPLPDDYILCRPHIEAHSVSRGDFAYSVGIGGEKSSVVSASNGLGSVLEDVLCLANDSRGRTLALIGYFKETQLTECEGAFARTVVYHPHQVKVRTFGSPFSDWRVHQSWFGTRSGFVGFLTFVNTRDHRGLICSEFYMAPSGMVLSCRGYEDAYDPGRSKDHAWSLERTVSPDNPEVLEIGTVKPPFLAQYGRLGLVALESRGQGMRLRWLDGVAGRMLRPPNDAYAGGFHNVIGNDVILDFSPKEGERDFTEGERCELTVAVLPCDTVDELSRAVHSGRVRMAAVEEERGGPAAETRAVCFEEGSATFIAVATTQDTVRDVRVRCTLGERQRSKPVAEVFCNSGDPVMRQEVNRDHVDLLLPLLKAVTIIRIE